MSFSAVEVSAMHEALKLARIGVGLTYPNPSVGCVIVDQSNTPIAGGRSAPAGGPHAEVIALSEAGAQASGGTLIVTLEPCTHHGRTGPCVAAIIEAGIRRVVVAVADPNPVAAGGIEQLKAAGIDVECGLLTDEVAQLLKPWITSVSRGRPYVTWKYAASLDGCTAAADGTSTWITGPDARADVHRMRSRMDAMMVGSGTVLADNCQLTVRDAQGNWAERQPLRVVLDARARVPMSSKVFHAPGYCWWVTCREPNTAEELPERVSVKHVPVAVNGQGVDLLAVMALLNECDIRHVMLESGSTVATAALNQGLIDEIAAYIAPVFLGSGRPIAHLPQISTMSDALRWNISEVAHIGLDIRAIMHAESVYSSH